MSQYVYVNIAHSPCIIHYWKMTYGRFTSYKPHAICTLHVFTINILPNKYASSNNTRDTHKVQYQRCTYRDFPSYLCICKQLLLVEH